MKGMREDRLRQAVHLLLEVKAYDFRAVPQIDMRRPLFRAEARIG
jgi:hypothetical protein